MFVEVDNGTVIVFYIPVACVSCGDIMFLMDERTIGQRIRTIREQSGQTLTAIAQRAKLTKSTLSKIEYGQISAPISTLLRVADALGRPVGDFFVEAEPSVEYVLTRAGQGRAVNRDGSQFGYTYQALALDMPGKYAEPFALTIRPGDGIGKFKHGGQEFIYMLQGELEFTVGTTKLLLKSGDSLYFDPKLPHTTRVRGRKAAKFICIFLQERPVHS